MPRASALVSHKKDCCRGARLRPGWKPPSGLWETERMKKPFLRVTKWLGDIPVEAICALCPDFVFRASSSHHRPNKIEYQEKLQQSFDRHVKDTHPPADALHAPTGT